jgi:hypothetical protein
MMSTQSEDERIAALEQPRIDPATVVGWGVDADPRNDPTYPMRDRSHDDKVMNWQRPTQQPESTTEILQSTEHNRPTAVFGTSTPPSGISGAIRRQAFHKSEGKWSHWLLLLVADRLNVVEGLVDDFARGKMPNVPKEMGIRSEIQHNPSGLAQKVIVAGSVATLAVLFARSMQHSSRRHGKHLPRS